jgi:hypothetical protein
MSARFWAKSGSPIGQQESGEAPAQVPAQARGQVLTSLPARVSQIASSGHPGHCGGCADGNPRRYQGSWTLIVRIAQAKLLQTPANRRRASSRPDWSTLTS